VITFELLKHAHQAAGVERRIHLNVRHLAVEVIDHIAGSALPPRHAHGHGHVARKGGGGQLVSRQNLGAGS